MVSLPRKPSCHELAAGEEPSSPAKAAALKSCLSWASRAGCRSLAVLRGEQQCYPSWGQELQVFLLPQRQQPRFSLCRGLPSVGEPSEMARLLSGVAGSAVSEHPHKAGRQPGRRRSQPGHVPLAPVLLHPHGKFGPEITILFLQGVVQKLRTWRPGPIQKHGEWQPLPCTSVFHTLELFPLRSSGAQPTMLRGVVCPGRNAPESGMFSKLLYWEYHSSADRCSHSQVCISLQQA